MSRPISTKRLTHRLDLAWARLVKAQSATCERCEAGHRRLDAAHIIPRTNHRTRWLPRNGMVLCAYPCHRLWWHHHPLEAAEWIQAYRPADVAYLDSIKNEISHWSIPDKLEILADLESSLEREAA